MKTVADFGQRRAIEYNDEFMLGSHYERTACRRALIRAAGIKVVLKAIDQHVRMAHCRKRAVR
jgi:hypothetical protein